MEKYCDLHTHSYYSDGSMSPAKLVEAARQARLAAVVLSDHNTVAGLEEFKAAGTADIETVPGVEFSTEYEGQDVHILALFVRPENYEPINQMLQQYLQRKEESNRNLVQALSKDGMVMDYDTIRGKHAGSINRAVIAKEMIKKGYCASVKDAFASYLAPGYGYYVPPICPDPVETVRFIKSLGCTAVLAHPFLSLSKEQLHRFLPEAKKAGLDAMEVYYSKYDAATTAEAKEMAAQYDLLESGGSDFHGSAKPDIAIGTGRGDLRIPLSVLEGLRKCAISGENPVKSQKK